MLLLALVGAAIALEALASWRLNYRLYEWRDSEISLGLAFGWLVSGVVGGALAAVSISFGYQHRFLDVGATPWGGALAIVLADLVYYLWHRLNHAWPWLWASHFPHHTAKRLNILASARQGWTDVISGTWLFWASLGFAGFTPIQVGVYFAVLLLWQAGVHVEWAPKLGPLEWVFVTPSHHRVHHSLEPAHIDRNFGGVLIVWDRLCGTLAVEGPGPITRFGLAGFDADSSNPIEIVTLQWRAMFTRWRSPRGTPRISST
ncbi:MAG TPA: sterol desaturase family protein [Caulobacteraceae bacterium]|jgi:sterol desaturase/sphingolipid hydroxylase (fatty acid hydroxylase superfamily)